MASLSNFIRISLSFLLLFAAISMSAQDRLDREAFGNPDSGYALEVADSLGITIGVHNCDGWSESGGPGNQA